MTKSQLNQVRMFDQGLQIVSHLWQASFSMLSHESQSFELCGT